MVNAAPLTGNMLLDAIPRDEFDALSRSLAWAEYIQHDLISAAGSAISFGYFPVSGLCSVLSDIPDEGRVEAGVVGREEFIGEQIVLESGQSPLRIICQIAGRGLRMPAEDLLSHSRALPGFRAVLLRSIHINLVQLASTIFANSHYNVEERLARWIVMLQDRAESARFPLTHDFLALMLSVRRPTVTEALHALESRGLIRSLRGMVLVVDRHGLEGLAGSAYGQAEREHRRLIRPRGE